MVPKLRFPAFRDAGAWVEKRLGEVVDWITTNSLSRDRLTYDCGHVQNIHYGDIHKKFGANFRQQYEEIPFIKNAVRSDFREENFCQLGDVVIADASEDHASIGKTIEIFELGDTPLVAGLHTYIARPVPCALSLGFSGYLLRSTNLRRQIMQISQGISVLGISKDNLKNLTLNFPSLPEQQKIADCLTSIDDLITAEAQKLEILKIHKKGLMQQLFPAKGETRPKLRFPAFRDAGAWVEKRLGEVCNVNPKISNLPEEFIYIDLESVVSGSLVKESKINKSGAPSRAQRLLKMGDVIFQMVRPYQKNNYYLGKVGDYVASTGYAQLRAKGSAKFLYQTLHTASFVNRVLSRCTGTNYPVINSNDLVKIHVTFPSLPEQQKIADCLTSIDDLITAEAQKLEVLKIHKKGLMQQLFPAKDEAGGSSMC